VIVQHLQSVACMGEMICLGSKLRILNSVKMSVSVGGMHQKFDGCL
jgi:hypothetical protein